VSRPSNLGNIPQQLRRSVQRCQYSLCGGGNIAPLCDTLNSVLIGTNSYTTGYGVGTSVVIGYNNLNSSTVGQSWVIVGTNCLNSYTEQYGQLSNNLTVATLDCIHRI
jgi:hypothetical protein